MWKILLPVLTGLTLLFNLPALASEQLRPIPQTIEIKGKLSSEWVPDPDDWIRPLQPLHPDDPQLPIRPRPPIAKLKKVWKITAGGKVYYLDFGGDGKLPELAEKLDGRTVVAAGTLQAGTSTLAVSSLKADEHVNVEITGKLEFDPTEIWRPFGTYWYVAVAGQRYYLDFSGNRDLEKLTATVKGSVFVTGRLEADGRWLTVHVRSMKAEGGAANQESIAVEIKGVLDRMFSLAGEQVPGPWRVTAEGQVYTLDFAGHSELVDRFVASRLPGREVVVRGTLQGDRVSVSGLEVSSITIRDFIEDVALQGDRVPATNREAAGAALEERVYEGGSANYSRYTHLEVQ